MIASIITTTIRLLLTVGLLYLIYRETGPFTTLLLSALVINIEIGSMLKSKAEKGLDRFLSDMESKRKK